MTQNYFDKLLSPSEVNLSHVQSSQQKCITSIIHGQIVIQSNEKQLIFSSEDIKRNINQIEREIFMKNVQLKKEMKRLNTIMNNHSFINSGRKQQSVRKLKSKSVNYNSDNSLCAQSDSQLRIKQLKKLKVKLRKKNRQSERRRTQSQRQIQEQNLKQSQEMKKIERAERVQQIKKRLEKLNQTKKKRLQILSSKSMPLIKKKQLPHYKRMQKEQILSQMKKELETRMISRESRLKKRNLLQIIKVHQKTYMNNLKLRNNRNKTEASEKTQLQNEESVNQSRIKFKTRMHSETFVTIKSQFKQKFPLILKLKEKQKKFDEKRKKIRVQSSPQKKQYLQIQKDKMANPLKYNFLHKKLLTDEQIFSSFKDFNLNFDRQILGNLHFEESKRLMKKPILSNQNDIRLKTFQYEQVDRNIRHKTTIAQPQKSLYHNKIASNLIPKKQQTIIQKRMRLNTQISNALASSDRNSKIVDILKNQSSLHEDNVLKKIQKLKLQSNYEATNKLQADIDEQFLKSIKAKIACVDLLEK